MITNPYPNDCESKLHKVEFNPNYKEELVEFVEGKLKENITDFERIQWEYILRQIKEK
jgi:hypothetical protein